MSGVVNRSMEPKKVVASALIIELHYSAITRLVKEGKYLNESDFIRQAIVEKLKREGVLNE